MQQWFAAAETVPHNCFVAGGHELPEGWDLARLRRLEPSAELLSPAEHYTVWVDKNFVYQELHPDVIISFAGQCLLRSSGDPSWWMGEVDKTDGSIVCWGQYGDDLEEAIRNL
jgi:hypothetical protein